MFYRLALLLFSVAFITCPASLLAAADNRPVVLAAEGSARLAVVVADEASPRVRQAADTLAEYLGKISGAAFVVESGDGTRGVAVGLDSDFPKLQLSERWPANDPALREDYLLKTHPSGVHVIGATELALEHAVWDLLYRLGHRQFFPGKAWEVVPKNQQLALAVDVQEHPDYYARRIWYGYGPWDYAKVPYDEWCARNRATTGIQLSTGHAYDGILARNKAAFQAHPEYLGLEGGVRKSTKFCISNPGLRQLVVDDALAQFAAAPDKDSISVDPSDGLHWCECGNCQALGSISDRALTLANQVAAAVEEKHPGKFVGMYAYSGHSPPPGIKVHPRVVISVATAFIRGGFTADELFAGWSRQGATLGVREYFSVNTWDRDLPGRARGSDLDYLADIIPRFHTYGARFFSAESSDNWAPNGLGYYVASRLLWNVDEADQVDALVEDFLNKAFGPGADPMREFYQILDRGNHALMSDHLIGQMYRLLAEARNLTQDPATVARLNDLLLYTRYVELWSDYSSAKGAERQAHFEQVIRHIYRMRETMMVHSKALYRDVVNRDKSVSVPENATWGVPEDRNPWKASEPFSPQELAGYLTAGIHRFQLRGFEPEEFSTNLAPVTELKFADQPLGSMGILSRGKRVYHTWVTDPAQPIKLTVTGGRIYLDRGDVSITLASVGGASPPELASAEVPSDREPHAVSLQPQRAGLHTITVSDAAAGTVVEWPEGLPMTVVSSLEQPASMHGRWTPYFYVPQGTATVGGFSSGPGKLMDGAGQLRFTFENSPGYFRVPVPAGQDGRLWKFQQCAGNRLLMTVPPCLACSPDELLLPAEVIRQELPGAGK